MWIRKYYSIMFKTCQVTKNSDPLFKEIQIIYLVKYGDLVIIREGDNNNNWSELLSI